MTPHFDFHRVGERRVWVGAPIPVGVRAARESVETLELPVFLSIEPVNARGDAAAIPLGQLSGQWLHTDVDSEVVGPG